MDARVLETVVPRVCRILAPPRQGTSRPRLARLGFYGFEILWPRQLTRDLGRRDEFDVCTVQTTQILGGLAAGGQGKSFVATAGFVHGLEGFDGAFASESPWLFGPEGGEGVDAVIVARGLVAEKHNLPCARVQQDI